MKAFKKSLETSIKTLAVLAETHKDKESYVTESESHINVGKERGLNGTSFTVKSEASSCNAIIYNTKKDAEKYGADNYLLDGNNKHIYMRFTRASEFFSNELKEAEKLLKFIKDNEK